MTPMETAAVRERLAVRRAHLAAAVDADPTVEDDLIMLLRRVDAALDRLGGGHWPLCVGCRIPVEPELLAAAPAMTVCFDCLGPEDRRALERDLEGAARIQRALLPPPRLARDDWEVAWLWEPRGAVSGDHVDLLVPAECDGPAPVHLILGDVAGKGLAASLLQSHLHALFRALDHQTLPLGDLLTRANRQFHQAIGSASYATLIAARLGAGGLLELANAGHPRPLLADRRGVRPIEGAGVPLGLFAASTYVTRDVQLARGDVVLLYTDGLTEAERDDEEYGIGRTAAVLRRSAHLPLAELLAACRQDLGAFLAGSQRADDLTLVALRRTG